jgi:hypothetical protein
MAYLFDESSMVLLAYQDQMRVGSLDHVKNGKGQLRESGLHLLQVFDLTARSPLGKMGPKFRNVVYCDDAKDSQSRR